jgi:hypothetical protein
MVRAELTSELAAAITLSAGPPWFPADGPPLAIRLVGEAGGEIRCSHTLHSATLTVQLPTHAPGNPLYPLVASWVASDVDAEIARSLHDLKNLVYAAGVATDGNPAQAARHLAEARGFADRLARSWLLYKQTPTSTKDLHRFITDYLERKAVPPGVRLTPPPPQSRYAEINADLFRAVLDNLVNNAVEAMQGDGDITVAWAEDDRDGLVSLSLTDTGPGIPANVLESVANGQTALSSKSHGSGLGLASAARFLHRMGGALTAAPIGPVNAVGSGHRWIISLPAADASSSPSMDTKPEELDATSA